MEIPDELLTSMIERGTMYLWQCDIVKMHKLEAEIRQLNRMNAALLEENQALASAVPDSQALSRVLKLFVKDAPYDGRIRRQREEIARLLMEQAEYRSFLMDLCNEMEDEPPSYAVTSIRAFLERMNEQRISREE